MNEPKSEGARERRGHKWRVQVKGMHTWCPCCRIPLAMTSWMRMPVIPTGKLTEEVVPVSILVTWNVAGLTKNLHDKYRQTKKYKWKVPFNNWIKNVT